MNVAVLAIVNSSDVSTTTPGGVVRFTATFTNAGQVAYTGITIASNITNVLDDATPNGDQTATSGTLTLTSTGISWTGSIPVGGTRHGDRHGDRQQPRYREPGAGQHPGHRRGGQQLPGRGHRSRLLGPASPC